MGQVRGPSPGLRSQGRASRSLSRLRQPLLSVLHPEFLSCSTPTPPPPTAGSWGESRLMLWLLPEPPAAKAQSGADDFVRDASSPGHRPQPSFLPGKPGWANVEKQNAWGQGILSQCVPFCLVLTTEPLLLNKIFCGTLMPQTEQIQTTGFEARAWNPRDLGKPV